MRPTTTPNGAMPVHDDRLLFEFLILEGAQRSRPELDHHSQKARRLSPRFALPLTPPKSPPTPLKDTARLLADAGIVRNRLKIASAIENAKAFLRVQSEFGTFDNYIWRFVDGVPIQNRRRSLKEVPAATPISDAMSKDLKQRGFKFVGTTICYAFMQATGMVNDHLIDCFRHKELSSPARRK